MTHPEAHDASDTITPLSYDRYLLRRKVLNLAGMKFHIYDPEGKLVLYSRLKAFRLREDVRLYTDESMQTELLHISTQSILDISGTYDVHDTVSGEHLGSLQRKGLGSTFIRDHWLILDPAGNAYGEILEDSTVKALVRRNIEIVAMFMPQQYHATVDGQTVASFQQNYNPFVQKIDIDFTSDPEMVLDRRLGLAAAVLLCAIEGRQQ